MLRIFWILLAANFALASAQADTTPDAPPAAKADNGGPRTAETTGFSLLRFRANQFSVVQSLGYSLSGEASWNPVYSFSQALAIKGCFGAMLVKGTGAQIFAAEYEVLISLTVLGPIAIEGGAGLQQWFGGTGGASPVVSGNLAWNFSERHWGILNGLFAGYSAFLIPQDLTHEFKAGVGIAL